MTTLHHGKRIKDMTKEDLRQALATPGQVISFKRDRSIVRDGIVVGRIERSKISRRWTLILFTVATGFRTPAGHFSTVTEAKKMARYYLLSGIPSVPEMGGKSEQLKSEVSDRRVTSAFNRSFRP